MSRKQSTGKINLIKRLIPLLIAVIAILLAAGIVGLTSGKKQDAPERTTEYVPEDMVEINGVKCTPKKNIKSWLFIGVDAALPEEREENSPGRCDMLQLLVYDQKENTYSRLAISRDTMTDVNTVDEDGYYLGDTTMQIALAHASGDGKEISCENTVQAVSKLLYDQPIDGYFELSMDAIGTLNHLVGGVTVTIEDDFSRVDPALKKGKTVRLNDEQAVYFVRRRLDVADGTNENRMKRQSQYISSMKSMLMEKCQEDSAYALEIYDGMEEYMVTDQSRNDFINLAGKILAADEKKAPQIEGTIVENTYKEFTPDEDSLADAVIELFYDRVE